MELSEVASEPMQCECIVLLLNYNPKEWYQRLKILAYAPSRTRLVTIQYLLTYSKLFSALTVLRIWKRFAFLLIDKRREARLLALLPIQSKALSSISIHKSYPTKQKGHQTWWPSVEMTNLSYRG